VNVVNLDTRANNQSPQNFIEYVERNRIGTVLGVKSWFHLIPHAGAYQDQLLPAEYRARLTAILMGANPQFESIVREILPVLLDWVWGVSTSTLIEPTIVGINIGNFAIGMVNDRNPNRWNPASRPPISNKPFYFRLALRDDVHTGQ